VDDLHEGEGQTADDDVPPVPSSSTRISPPTPMHSKPAAIGIEDPVWHGERCDGHARRIGQKFEERREILGPHALRGEDRVAEGARVRCGRRGRVAGGEEGVCGRGQRRISPREGFGVLSSVCRC
jgi:hypothetical protein